MDCNEVFALSPHYAWNGKSNTGYSVNMGLSLGFLQSHGKCDVHVSSPIGILKYQPMNHFIYHTSSKQSVCKQLLIPMKLY